MIINSRFKVVSRHHLREGTILFRKRMRTNPCCFCYEGSFTFVRVTIHGDVKQQDHSSVFYFSLNTCQILTCITLLRILLAQNKPIYIFRVKSTFIFCQLFLRASTDVQDPCIGIKHSE